MSVFFGALRHVKAAWTALQGWALPLTIVLAGACDFASLPLAAPDGNNDVLTDGAPGDGDAFDDPSDNEVLSSGTNLPVGHTRSQPTDLTVFQAGTNLVELTWTEHSSNETGFVVQRYTSASGWVDYATTGPDVATFVDSEVNSGTGYCYRIMAFNDSAVSAFSALQCVTPTSTMPDEPGEQDSSDGDPGSGGATGDPTTPPDGKPADLEVSATALGIELVWTDSASNEQGFTIRRYTARTGWTSHATTGTDVTSFVDTQLEPETGYCYRVEAFNAAGTSPASAMKCVTSGSLVPEEPPVGPPGTDLSPCEGVSLIDCPSDSPGRAFPSAEGFGAQSRGGRGGRVIPVTDLRDYNPVNGEPPIVNTLRWALEEFHEPRIVTFRVGGTIPLKRTLRICGPESSYVTLAGQSAPGDGIQIRNYGLMIGYGVHDVIVRHLRIRPGYTTDGSDVDALVIYGANGQRVYNVMIDHCSLEWAIDENCDVYDDVERITMQYNIFGEGSIFGHTSGEHSMGCLVGGARSRNVDAYVTMHHNLFINNTQRNPLLANNGGLVHLVNNLIVNYGGHATTIARDSEAGGPSPRANVIGNVYRRGAAYLVRGDRRPVDLRDVDDATIYVSDNIGPHRSSGDIDDWEVVGNGSASPSAIEMADRNKQRNSPWPTSGVPVTVEAAADLEATLLQTVGASYPNWDAVDSRLIREARTLDGDLGFGPSIDDHEPHPVLRTGTPPADQDRDGMPDAWEEAQGLDPHNPRDGTQDPDRDGYTNVEEYLNSLVGEF